MSEQVDYTEYRNFLKEFAATVDPNDQLPVRFGGYNVTESEIPGEVIDWTIQYLTEKKCPQTLIAPIVQTVMKETNQSCQKSREACGYDLEYNAYQPLQLMRTVTSHVNNICQRLLDNSELDKIPPPTKKDAPPKNVATAIKNTRRKMEDRHVCIDDFNAVYSIDNAERTSFYAVFDGHGGQGAANYAVSHLHRFLAASRNYPTNPVEALKDAFRATDLAFIDKCEKEVRDLKSGTTALAILYRPQTPCLYVAWAGDSQALIVREGKIFQIVHPHKPEDESERARIDKDGGFVVKWNGYYRVNGTLAVSRAIGDVDFKPYVTAEPDVKCIPLDGKEDFLIIACDGLWDFVSEDDVAINVYLQVRRDPDNLELVTQKLVKLSKTQGSSDNISVIVVFLKDPHVIATSSWPSSSIPTLDNMETAFDSNQEPRRSLYDTMDFESNTSTNGLATTEQTTNILPSDIENENFCNFNSDIMLTSKGLDLNNLPANNTELLSEKTSPIDDDDNTTTNLITSSANGKPSACALGEEDLGPETDVDTLDEIMMSPKENTNEIYNFESNEKLDMEAQNFMSNNPFNNEFDSNLAAPIKCNDDDDEFIEHMNPFDDNKLRDMIEIDETKVAAELVEQALAKEFVSEKKDISFEKDTFEENEFFEKINQEQPLQNRDDQFESQLYQQSAFDRIPEEFEPRSDYNQNDEYIGEPVCTQVLESSGTAEHVVAESGGDEDSEEDEEWNYVKVEKNEKEKVEKTNEKEKNQHHNEELTDELTSTTELLKSEEDNIQSSSYQGPSDVDQPKKIIENLVGEIEKIAEREKETISLEIVGESQEAVCTELIEGNLDSLEDELVELEKENENQEKQLLVAENDDDMSSQLNPDAKEFVPTSPVRSSPQSPHAQNGSVSGVPGLTLAHTYLIDDDTLIAQSPRKGTPMENIEVPAENDFDEDISKRPAELGSSDQSKNVDLIAGEFNRPGSSSSQASYQEMNLKEAMHGDEKLEYAPETEDQTDRSILPKEIPIENDQVLQTEAKVLSESDPMNMSFYQDQGDDENPFDMNAVHQLPLSDEEDNVIAENSSIDDATEHQQNGLLHYKDNVGTVISNSVVDQSAQQQSDEISKPEEDMYSPISDNKLANESSGQLNEESDKPESELFCGVSGIVQAAQEMATEVTTLLITANNESTQSPVSDVQFEAEQFVEDIKEDAEREKYIESGLSPVAPEFQFNAVDMIEKVEDSAESDHVLIENHQSLSSDHPEVEQHVMEADLLSGGGKPASVENLCSVTKIETLTQTPVEADIEVFQRIGTPEPQKIVEAVEKLIEPEVVVPVALETPSDLLTRGESPNSAENHEIAAAAAVAATTIAATAAIASQIVDDDKKIDKSSKVPDSKKADAKSTTKVAITKTVGTKPTLTTTKKAAPTTTTKTATSTGKQSSVSLTAKSTTLKPATKPSVTATRPKSTVTSTSKTGTAVPPEKKLSTTTASTLAAKKPLGLSSATTVRKTTTTTTVTKISNVTAKPAVTTKTTATTARSSGTNGLKTTTSRNVASKTGTTSTAVSKLTAAPKPTAATTKPTATKPTSNVTLKARPASTLNKTSSATSARISLSPSKPRTTTSATNSTDKQTKDIANKSRTSGSLTANVASARTPRTPTTPTTRKSSDLKCGTTPGSATRTTTTRTSTTAMATTPGNATKRSPTATTRTSLTKKTTQSTTAVKSPNIGNKTATKVTTVKLEKQIINGNVISETEITNTQLIDHQQNGHDLIINENGNNDNCLLKKDDSPMEPLSTNNLIDNNQQQMIVIDSSAD